MKKKITINERQERKLIREYLDKKFMIPLKQKLMHKNDIDPYGEDDYEFEEYSTEDSMDYKEDVHNEWLIHFSYNADKIWREGFKKSNPDINNLGVTNDTIIALANEGYSFGYDTIPMDFYPEDFGDKAVVFQANGIKVYHLYDADNQVIFYNNSAKNFVLLQRDEEYGNSWSIIRNDGKIFKSFRSIEKAFMWIRDNYSQYSKILSNPQEHKVQADNMKNSSYAKDLEIQESIRIHKGENGKKNKNNGKWADTIKCPHCSGDAFFSMSISDGNKGRGRIKVTDEQGKEIDSEVRAIALYYCPQCHKFTAHNNMS